MGHRRTRRQGRTKAQRQRTSTQPRIGLSTRSVPTPWTVAAPHKAPLGRRSNLPENYQPTAGFAGKRAVRSGITGAGWPKKGIQLDNQPENAHSSNAAG